MSELEDTQNKLIKIYRIINRPRTGMSKKALYVSYEKRVITDALTELKEIMIENGLEFKLEK